MHNFFCLLRWLAFSTASEGTISDKPLLTVIVTSSPDLFSWSHPVEMVKLQQRLLWLGNVWLPRNLWLKGRSDPQVLCHPYFVKREVLPVIPYGRASGGPERWLQHPVLFPKEEFMSVNIFSALSTQGFWCLGSNFIFIWLPSVSQSEQQKVQKLRYMQRKHFHTDKRVFS